MRKTRYQFFMAALALCALATFINPSSARGEDRGGQADTPAKCGDGKINQPSEVCDDGPSGSPTCTPQCTKIAPTPVTDMRLKRLDADDGHIKVLTVDELRLKTPLTTEVTLRMPELVQRQSYGFAFMARYLIGVESPVPNMVQLDAAVLWRDVPTHCGFRFGVSPGGFWFPGGMNGDSKGGFALSGAAAFLVGWEYGGLYVGPELHYLGSGYRDQIMVAPALHGFVLFNGDKDANTGILDFGLGVPVLRPHNMFGQEDSFHTVLFTVALGWFTRPQPLPAEPVESAR